MKKIPSVHHELKTARPIIMTLHIRTQSQSQTQFKHLLEDSVDSRPYKSDLIRNLI